MSGFTKLFSTLVTSTIWSEDDKTRILWITMLALTDRFGVVPASVPGLAKIAGMTTEECEASIEKLMSPDKHSRTKDHEGRRIVAVDGGWRILNYQKYREMGRSAERTEYLRFKQAERRAKIKNLSTNVNQNQPIAEADRNGACECCGTPFDGPSSLYVVRDHCHKRLIDRGLVCKSCNKAIGEYERGMPVKDEKVGAVESYLAKYADKIQHKTGPLSKDERRCLLDPPS